MSHRKPAPLLSPLLLFSSLPSSPLLILIFSRHSVASSSLLVWSCLGGMKSFSKWWLNLTKWLPPLRSDIMFSPCSSPLSGSFSRCLILSSRCPFSPPSSRALSYCPEVWFLFLNLPPSLRCQCTFFHRLLLQPLPPHPLASSPANRFVLSTFYLGQTVLPRLNLFSAWSLNKVASEEFSFNMLD